MQLINGEKDRKHVSVQKVVTCMPDIPAASLPHITAGSFTEPPMPTHNRLFSQPPTFGGMQHYLQKDKKSLAFYKVVW